MNGECLCGSVKYELTEQIQDTYYCHCRDCQVLSGSAFRVLGIVSRNSLKIKSGEISTYDHKTESGFEMVRSYCIQCATPLFVSSTRFPDMHMLMVSTLNNTALVDPSFQIWCSSMVSWAKVSIGIRSHPHGALD